MVESIMGPPGDPRNMLAFSEADALYGGPTVPTTATWTRLVAQLAQVCEQDCIFASLARLY